MDLPQPLRHAIEIGECVLFLGAGIGEHLFDVNGSPAPDATDLINALAKHFNVDDTIIRNQGLDKVAEYIELKNGRPELENFIKKQLYDLQPDDTLQWLFTLPWRAIFTTNYDSGIQRAYQLIENPKQNPVTITMASQAIQTDPRIEVPIYHLHGTIFEQPSPKIVITKKDYLHYLEGRKCFEILRQQFALSTILYIGYSNRDPIGRNTTGYD